MSIEIQPLQRVFRYNGISLPDIPGLEPNEIRDIYSAQYPELVSAEIQTGEIVNGAQEYVFRKAVGTKGAGRLAALQASIESEITAAVRKDKSIEQAMTRKSVRTTASAWQDFTRVNLQVDDRPEANRVLLPSDVLALVA